MKQVAERLIEYVKMDTQSDPESRATPSTKGQLRLAESLAAQLGEMGAQEICLDREHGYVYASIPPTEGCEQAPVLGFIAHMDTSPAVSGSGVKPRRIECYDGGDIVLNEEKKIIMKTEDFPELVSLKGKSLIVTDGTTLLGADDKAGIAEIMSMAEYFLLDRNAQNRKEGSMEDRADGNGSAPDRCGRPLKHGKIRIGFTPDEEIGAGADHFDVDLFGADFAYTVDGGALGELEYENFNAAEARVTFHGRSVHPGTAKGRMRNAILMAQEFQSMLPAAEDPMYTEGYEGFYHLDSIRGNVEETRIEYIIRDHDRGKFEKRKEQFLRTGAFLDQKYGDGAVEMALGDSYYNMREVIEKNYHLIENAKAAMEELSIEPRVLPIRGGTDGARLSFMGLPCPNLNTGGGNFHGCFEYVCVESMERIVELLIRIVQKYGEE